MSPDERTNFERTRELGEALAKDLDDHDVLGRWMAHHISDLITRADAADTPNREAARQEAADTILKLWDHRDTAPLRSRPTHNIDIIIWALERLESPQGGRFYRIFDAGAAPDQDTIASVIALKLALDLEQNVRDVVIQVLGIAANEAEQKDAAWIKMTEHLVEDNQRSIWRLIRQVEHRRRQLAPIEPESEAKSEDEDRDGADETDAQDRGITPILAGLQDAQLQLAAICTEIENIVKPQKAP